MVGFRLVFWPVPLAGFPAERSDRPNRTVQFCRASAARRTVWPVWPVLAREGWHEWKIGTDRRTSRFPAIYFGVSVRSALGTSSCARRSRGPKRACARRSLGKEERCKKQLKTFRRNPASHRARPEESGQQPEASLASWQATPRAKRRQRVPELAHPAPKLGLIARPHAVRACGGRTPLNSSDFSREYARRAGIEGTISPGVRACGLRRSRYVGEARRDRVR